MLAVLVYKYIQSQNLKNLKFNCFVDKDAIKVSKENSKMTEKYFT